MDKIEGLAERLIASRKNAHLTQGQAAEAAGINRGMIAKYETEAASPTVFTITKISKALNVSTDYLLGLEHEKEQSPIEEIETIAAHETDGADHPLTEKRLNEILKQAFAEYEKKTKQLQKE